MSRKTWLDRATDPAGWVKWLFKIPILFYRLGLGSIAGRIFMVMTTIGHTSRKPRCTAIEFHEYKGRKYIFSAWLVFQGAAQWAGKEMGYLLGFLFYWLFWCLLVPGLAFRKVGLGNLLKDQKRLFSWETWLAALLWMSVAAGAIAMYGQSFIQAPLTLIWLAIPFAIFNGICEEILWRGLYVRAFPNNPWLGGCLPGCRLCFLAFRPLKHLSGGESAWLRPFYTFPRLGVWFHRLPHRLG